MEITAEECIDRYFSNPYKCFKKDYDIDKEVVEEQQKVVRPILNNYMWMYGSLRCILQQSSKNTTEEFSNAIRQHVSTNTFNNSLEGSTEIDDPSIRVQNAPDPPQSSQTAPSIESWPVSTPEQAQRYFDEIERLRKRENA